MQPISHRTGQQLHLHVWVFGPHLWHCSMPGIYLFIGGVLKSHTDGLPKLGSPTKPFGNSIFHLLAFCLICLCTKRDRTKLSAAQVPAQVKKKKKSVCVTETHKHSCFSLVLISCGVV